MTGIWNWITENWVVLLAIWGGICVAIDGITGLTKTDKDDAIWAKIKKVIVSIISLNPNK